MPVFGLAISSQSHVLIPTLLQAKDEEKELAAMTSDERKRHKQRARKEAQRAQKEAEARASEAEAAAAVKEREAKKKAEEAGAKKAPPAPKKCAPCCSSVTISKESLLPLPLVWHVLLVLTEVFLLGSY